MSENPTEKPKIIVDDDWKSQVEAEKEALQKQKDEGGPEQHRHAEMPPASFSVLVTSLATQAMVAMGTIPDPAEKKPIVRRDLAKHYIDILGILEEKTKGNLEPDETSMLSAILHELRMAYVALAQQPKPEAADESPIIGA